MARRHDNAFRMRIISYLKLTNRSLGRVAFKSPPQHLRSHWLPDQQRSSETPALPPNLVAHIQKAAQGEAAIGADQVALFAQGLLASITIPKPPDAANNRRILRLLESSEKRCMLLNEALSVYFLTNDHARTQFDTLGEIERDLHRIIALQLALGRKGIQVQILGRLQLPVDDAHGLALGEALKNLIEDIQGDLGNSKPWLSETTVSAPLASGAALGAAPGASLNSSLPVNHHFALLVDLERALSARSSYFANLNRGIEGASMAIVFGGIWWMADLGTAVIYTLCIGGFFEIFVAGALGSVLGFRRERIKHLDFPLNEGRLEEAQWLVGLWRVWQKVHEKIAEGRKKNKEALQKNQKTIDQIDGYLAEFSKQFCEVGLSRQDRQRIWSQSVAALKMNGVESTILKVAKALRVKIQNSRDDVADVDED